MANEDIVKLNRNGAERYIGDSKVRNSIVNEFSITTSYSTDDLTLYNGELYRFNTNHEIGGWDSSQTNRTNIADVIKITEESWTASDDPGCNLSGTNKLWRIGNIGYAKIIITGWSSTTTKSRDIYKNLSILPCETISYGVCLKNSNNIQTGFINITTDGRVQFGADGTFTGGVVRAYIPFPCISKNT